MARPELLTTVASCTALLIAAAPAHAQSIDCGTSYTIQRGDNLSRISARAYGPGPFQPLYAHNRDIIGPNPNLIIPGEVLDIPCFAADGSVIVQTTTELAGIVAEDVDADDTVILTFNRASAPPFIINSGIIDPYLAEITAVTEGRVQFVDPAEVNRDHAAQYDLVTSGTVDGAYVLNVTLADSHPLLQLPMLPLMGGSAEQTAVSLWRIHETYLAQTDYFDEAQVMGFIAAPAAHIWRDETMPVTVTEGIADKNMYAVPYFSGLDTRGPAAVREEVAGWMADYQASSDTMPAFFMAHGAVRAVGLWSDTMKATEVDNGLYTPTFTVLLSNEAWAQISPEDQAAIRAVSGEVLSHRSASWDAFDNGFRSDMLANGLKYEKADEALLANLRYHTEMGLQDWSAAAETLGVPAAQAIQSYEAHLKSLEDRLIYRAMLGDS